MRYLLVVIVCSLVGCQQQQEDVGKKVSEYSKDLSESFDAAKKKVDEMTPEGDELKEGATGELEKLFTFEYKVVEFDKKLTSAELENELNLLGKERWECFHVERSETELQFFCSRRPRTYLRYIPRVF